VFELFWLIFSSMLASGGHVAISLKLYLGIRRERTRVQSHPGGNEKGWNVAPTGGLILELMIHLCETAQYHEIKCQLSFITKLIQVS